MVSGNVQMTSPAKLRLLVSQVPRRGRQELV